MAPISNRETIDRFFKVLNEKRFDDLVALLDPEVIQEWPQSGERFRGRDNIKSVLTNFPGFPKAEVKRVVGAEDKWVLGPTWTPLQVIGTGDDYTIESYINYPNGERWHSVAIVQFRNGKVHRLTEYFAAPFPPAEWRAPWAERKESSSQSG